MDDRTARQLKGAGKMAYGAYQVASGIATATGHGLLGGLCRSHHLMGHAARMGALSVKSGVERIKEGLEDVNR